MPEKYDLNRMLKEVKEDEEVVDAPEKKLSQEEIQRMLRERRKKPKGKI
jgi:hypothetical protein